MDRTLSCSGSYLLKTPIKREHGEGPSLEESNPITLQEQLPDPAGGEIGCAIAGRGFPTEAGEGELDMGIGEME